MAIPEEFIQELKSKTDIVDVISSYVSLKKAGRNMLGLCPFHNEKTPSFTVFTDKNNFHCFGCRVGGDVFTFIRRIENLDYVDAIKFLAKRAGMEVPEGNRNDGLSRLRNRIYEANREAAKFYHEQLYSPNGKKALEYLRQRGLTEQTIVHFGLGYAPQSRFELVNYLKSKQFTNSELIQANLANQSQRGNSCYDRFSDRVMFPIMDLKGDVIAFGGRIMSDIKPKYLNTSDTPAFSKSRNLYALQFAKNKAKGQLILVEGYMDVIALHQAGFENTVATLGTALTGEQANIISRYCDEVVICYDADNAGQNATAKAIRIFRNTNIKKIKVLTVPNGKDPDEFIKSHGENGPARFRLLLDKCGNDIEYRIAKMRIKYDLDKTDQKADFLNEVSKMLAQLGNSIEYDAYISALSEELNISKEAVYRQTKIYSAKEQQHTEKKIQYTVPRTAGNAYTENSWQPNHTENRAANAEKALLAILLTNPDTISSICQAWSAEKFVTPFYRKVYEIIANRAEQGLTTDQTDISGQFSVDENSQIETILLRPRENEPFRAAQTYIDILEEESEKLSPEQIVNTDIQILMEKIQKKGKR